MQALLPVPSRVSLSKPVTFDASVLEPHHDIPEQFIWPDDEKPCLQQPPELDVPPIDLGGFLSGNPIVASIASRAVNKACKQHGFFLLVNHGVDSKLLVEAHKAMDHFFGMPICQKQRAQRKTGDHCGYASSFIGRFSTKLPWKETLSFRYSADDKASNMVENYFLNAMGSEFGNFG